MFSAEEGPREKDVAIGTLFKSGSRDLLEQIRTKTFASAEERQMVYESLATSVDLKPAQVIEFLFSPDGELRRAVTQLLAARKDPQTVVLIVKGLKGRPEAARRAALSALDSMGLGSIPAQLSEIMTGKDQALRKPATEALLDLPLNQETLPLLTKVIDGGEAAHRLKAVQRFSELATAANVPFFERLLYDRQERIRLAAYHVICKHAGLPQLPLLISRVPNEPYSTQQLLVKAIQKLAPQGGDEALEQILGLLASGNTGLRNAALKILMAMPDRVAIVRRFIAFTQKLVGWVRDRALESMREFGESVVEPALVLVQDPDPDVRGAALTLLSGFQDPRVVQAGVQLLGDDDWWLAINAADLLGSLGDQRAVPALAQALQREEVRWAAVESLGRLGGPQALQALSQLVKDERAEIRTEALSALALSGDARVVPILKQAAETDPEKSVRARAFEMMTEVAAKTSAGFDEAAVRSAVNASKMAAGAPQIHQLLALARKQDASDLHVSVDSVPILRCSGELIRLNGEPLTPQQTDALLRPLMNDKQWARLQEDYQLDACFCVPNDGRYRGNLFQDRKGLNGVFRVIPDRPPTVGELGLPGEMNDIALYHQGIVIVTGPSGSGKSTTLAALVNLISETRRDHILMLEDPVEFVHPFKSSLINQREVGKHTETYSDALRAALREDPDVIVIGELRDKETIELGLTAAETGHVVLSTLNATTAHKAVDRVISAFPVDEQAQVRESFAGALKLVLAQTLVESADGKGRVGCFELLKATRPICNVIKDCKTFQIPSLMTIGSSAGMQTFDDALMALVRSGKIKAETGYIQASNKDLFEPLVPPKFLEELLA
jgi:twitching motility protein PilT